MQRHPLLASMPLLSVVLLTATLFSNIAAAQTVHTTDIQSIVDAAVKPLMAEYGIPGAVIGITLDGKQYFYQYGVSSITTGQSVTEHTLFEIGSISKTFTATLANYAQIEGKLLLTDMTSDYVPALKGSHFDEISLINLATHTVGDLPMQVPDKVTNNAELMDYLKHWQPSFAPGTHRNYANPSIGLLGMIAAQSLDKTFQQALEQTLFPQLGMTSSYIQVPSSKMADYAQGYNKQDMPVRVNPGVLADEAYGVKTTATDLLHFVEANMQMHPLAKPLQTALDETHTGYFDVGMMTQDMIWEHYSYPIDLEKILMGHTQEVVFGSTPVKPIVPPLAPQQNVWINKTGSTGGFAAYAAFIPAQKLGIVLLSNKNYPVPPRVTVGYQILTGIEKLQK
ncbi:class C beta-lactamase [Shewanella vaxholmensis]|uniref:Beta-lactamase n=1 Tax=Shewanella vaxholmensis TaxID=3063535 RepID=A0ABU9UU96_9GAMM|nr:class C beta-lactamase [Shewanella sp. SP1S1-4]MDT3308155.1 class C beta-lactamase [Shewanella sp. SP1S1-4]